MEQQRREGLGEGERIKNEMLGRAEGMRAIFEANAEGIRKLVEASGGDANAAFLLMMADRVPAMMEIQAKAISNFKIDKVTVWDGGGKDGNAISGLVRDYATCLPPLQDLLQMTGVVGPGLLGRKEEEKPARQNSRDADKVQ